MEKLFPVFDVPSTIEDEQNNNAGFLPAPLWDFETGDFVIDGAYRTHYGSGYDAWVLWCTKTVMTQRWAHLAYSGNTGIEADEAFSQPDKAAVMSAFERTVTEALTADPMGRTLAVRDFDFFEQPDGLLISFKVIGTDGSTADIRAKVNDERREPI